MNTPYAIQTAIEIILVAALIIGLFHESTIADLEQKIINKIRSRLTKTSPLWYNPQK